MGARVTEAATEAYDTAATYLGELGGKSDAALTGMFDVEGLTVPAPDRGLTVPINDKLPGALQQASNSPDAIAALQRRATSRIGSGVEQGAESGAIMPPPLMALKSNRCRLYPPAK